ncbi:MAG: hypothetical protein N2Z71_06905, partial [Caloramator sp.]|nr:hypothetical protein [Caloramator sp.]
LTSINEDGLENISKYLSDFDLVERLKGNVCVINSMGTAKTYYMQNGKFIYKSRLVAYICLGMSVFLFLALILFSRNKEYD